MNLTQVQCQEGELEQSLCLKGGNGCLSKSRTLNCSGASLSRLQHTQLDDEPRFFESINTRHSQYPQTLRFSNQVIRMLRLSEFKELFCDSVTTEELALACSFHWMLHVLNIKSRKGGNKNKQDILLD